MYKFISKSEEDTINFANDFAKNLKVGDIVPTTHNRQYEALYKINEIIYTK